MEKLIRENEYLAESAFNKQAGIFDQLYAANTIINYKRERVRSHVLQYINPGGYILELNSGTGEDALFFAQRGFKVHATDISTAMQAELKQKITKHSQENNVTNELCSFTQLNNLQHQGPYDLIFSNFAGLNCTVELDQVLASFSSLLKDKGLVTLVILPKFCFWETMLLFRGKFKTAFRRFFSSKGRESNVEGIGFKCWYYQPSFIKKQLDKEFEVLSVEGLCTLVPPSYLENFAEKHPVSFHWLTQLENRLKCTWPWRNIGDYYIISLRKR